MSPLTPPAGEPVREAVARAILRDEVARMILRSRGFDEPSIKHYEKCDTYLWLEAISDADAVLALPALARTQNAQPVAWRWRYDPSFAWQLSSIQPAFPCEQEPLYATSIPVDGEAEIAGRLREEAASWRRVAERCESEKQAAEARVREQDAEIARKDAALVWARLVCELHVPSTTPIFPAIDAALARSEQPTRDGGE